MSWLNEFQRKAWEAYVSSESNLVFYAPTGSGKTFLMRKIALEHVLKTNKIVVYISPLRALSAEFHSEISKEFPKSLLITGDVWENDDEDIKDNKIISMTYEKFDSAIRKNREWLTEVGLLLVDEIHNISQRRALEVILQWALENKIRVITASATVKNLESLANYLNAKTISAEERPVRLHKFVLTPLGLFSENFEKVGDATLETLIEKAIKHDKNILIFEATRKKAEDLANRLKPRFEKVEAFHAGLDRQRRIELLEKFRKGEIKILTTTTALSQGINTPAYMVVIHDIRLPVIENGIFKGWRYLSRNEIEQMLGRAGRPGFEKEGVGVIVVHNDYEARYIRKVITGEYDELKGSLDLYNAILIYTAIHSLVEKEKIENAIRQYFSFYNKDISKDEIDEAIDILTTHGILGRDELGNIYATKYAKVASEVYLDLEDMIYFKEITDDYGTEIDVSIIANAPKVKKAFRGDTEKALIMWTNGDDVEEIIAESSDPKANVTINDFKNFIDTATWQSYALFHILSKIDDKRKMDGLKVWLSVRHGVPFGVVNLMNLRGIGRKLAIMLYENGYTKKKEICGDKERVKAILSQEGLANQIWRIDELCKQKS
jgi:helicase